MLYTAGNKIIRGLRIIPFSDTYDQVYCNYYALTYFSRVWERAFCHACYEFLFYLMCIHLLEFYSILF